MNNIQLPPSSYTIAHVMRRANELSTKKPEDVTAAESDEMEALSFLLEKITMSISISERCLSNEVSYQAPLNLPSSNTILSLLQERTNNPSPTAPAATPPQG